MNKKIIAREWLMLVCLLIFGFILFPFVMSLLTGGRFLQFYEALAYGEAMAWVVGFSPYVIYLFVRSIVWAVKTLKPKEG